MRFEREGVAYCSVSVNPIVETYDVISTLNAYWVAASREAGFNCYYYLLLPAHHCSRAEPEAGTRPAAKLKAVMTHLNTERLVMSELTQFYKY